MYNFTVDVSGLIKSIDQNHSVSLGTLGTKAGINVGKGRTFRQRADLFEAKIQAAFDREVAGYLIWKGEDGCTSGNCVTEGDLVLEVVELYR